MGAVIRESVSERKSSDNRRPPSDLIAARRLNTPELAGAREELRRRTGNQAMRRLMGELSGRLPAGALRAPSIQAKLTVSAPGDAHEREADRVADAVMLMATTEVADQSRLVSTTSPAKVQRMCADCEDEQKRKAIPQVQGKQQAADTPSLTAPVAANIHVLRGGGSLLPVATRAFFEPRFGADFSNVRVHTGAKAEEIAKSINARAFTIGQNIAFSAGEYAPETTAGRKLLAHELTHVVQQAGGINPSEGLIQRKPDEFDLLIRNGDWHGAAWTLAQRDPADIAARVSSMSSTHRRYLVEGARHGEGNWNTETIVSAVDKISHRDAIIGSVKFFVWKHLWGKAGTYLCGLNNPDMRRVAIDLRLTIRDMQIMADEQTDKTQSDRL
ncbi:MAG: DUF4157 domain-containing protein, partial [Burkholderiales bacterium]